MIAFDDNDQPITICPDCLEPIEEEHAMSKPTTSHVPKNLWMRTVWRLGAIPVEGLTPEERAGYLARLDAAFAASRTSNHIVIPKDRGGRNA